LLLGLLSWVVAILCLLAAVLLADFGAGLPWLLPPVLYLLTLGLPTFAAAHVVIWLLDAAGPLPSRSPALRAPSSPARKRSARSARHHPHRAARSSTCTCTCSAPATRAPAASWTRRSASTSTTASSGPCSWWRLRPSQVLRLAAERNLLERDYQLKLALGVPAEVFERGAQVLAP
jgi:hypothetical protein